MDRDESGLLGNLPRSRPGTRSEKRGATAPAKPDPPAREPEAESSGDPVSAAVRTVARTANGLTREILRRLPRP